MSAPRPRREKKGDRLFSRTAAKAEVQVDYAVAPFDRMATEMDMLWGIDRLPELVSPETAEKYGYSIARLNEAIEASNPEDAKAWAGVCMRGMQVMDAEARANGALPATGDFWEHEVDDPETGKFRIAVLRDGAEWQTAHARRPDLRFFTMREVTIAMQAYCRTVPLGEVKDAFPAARITRITAPPNNPKPEDDF